MNIALPFPVFRFPFHRPVELRIDVDRPLARPLESLDALYDRLYSPGDSLYGLPAVELRDPELQLRLRESDGEHYVYVEDVRRRCLAGSTVFNRMVELGRRADRHLRSPHSTYRPEYQRRGIATSVYGWALDSGICLLTGARQSPGAHALWLRLAQRYGAGFVDVRDKTITYLGDAVPAAALDRLETRMFLMGAGWS